MMGLSPEQTETLGTLREIFPQIRCVLIGASAISCFMDMHWRQTHDLDVMVSISQRQYSGTLRRYTDWTRDPSREYRWFSPQGVRVDIIPAGPQDLANGNLVWDTTGAVMNLTGFRHVFERAVTIQLAPDCPAEIAPPEVIVLLKMVAYLDRPQERARDLEDLSYLIEGFADPDSEERFSDEILELGMAFEVVSAYLLGKKLTAIVDEKETRLVGTFLLKVEDEDDPDHTQARMATAWPWHGSPGDLLLRIAAFRKGLETRARRG
jgi:predicted nucleotidyltransferase